MQGPILQHIRRDGGDGILASGHLGQSYRDAMSDVASDVSLQLKLLASLSFHPRMSEVDPQRYLGPCSTSAVRVLHMAMSVNRAILKWRFKSGSAD